MIKIDEKDLFQLLISEFRYAVKRDNHLAPSTCVQHVMSYLPEMAKDWRANTAYQLTDEVITERVWGSRQNDPLGQDAEWERLLVFLTNYLETLPLNVDRYMHYLYNKPNYSASIDYYSVEMAEKIKNNQMKKIGTK